MSRTITMDDFRRAYGIIAGRAAECIAHFAPDEHMPLILAIELGDNADDFAEVTIAPAEEFQNAGAPGKEQMMVFVRGLLDGSVRIRHTVDMVAHVTEAWMTAINPNEPGVIMPEPGKLHEDPRRTEALVVALHAASHTEVRCSPITGEGRARRVQLVEFDGAQWAGAEVSGRLVLDDVPPAGEMH